MKNLISTATINELITIRKQIHADPEVSGKEIKTAEKIADYLHKCRPTTILKNIGGTGVVAQFDSGHPGTEVLFRAELDALPIQEINTFGHVSKTKGVSHKCGHDGHATVLLGLAKVLSEHPPLKGKITLLFQPAEENGEGAKAILADPEFNQIHPDYVFAFHNLPGYPLHEIVLRDGSFTAAVKSIIIKLNGKTAHAAEPENGINPALAIAEILSATDNLSNNDPGRQDFTLITPIHIEMGEIAYGISAGYGELRLTIRTWTEEVMAQLTKDLMLQITAIGKKYGIKPDCSWTQEFSANQNNNTAVSFIRNAARTLEMNIQTRAYPFKWGEDFGLFTQKYKGAMFGIGSGMDCPALHNPDYDFPDALLEQAIQLFYQISTEVLS